MGGLEETNNTIPDDIESQSHGVAGEISIRMGNILSGCSQCGVSCYGCLCILCQRDIDRGGYADYFPAGKVLNKTIFQEPQALNSRYEVFHEIMGKQSRENAEVFQVGYEIYSGCRVLVLRIDRKKPWIHKGRKVVDGKVTDTKTFTPKVSDKQEFYRVCFDPNNLTKKELVIYGGKLRNGNLVPDHELDYAQMLKFVEQGSYGE